MKYMRKLAMIATVALGTVFGTSCATDLRDAALTGMFDWVAGTTTELISAVSPFDDFVEAE